MEQMTFFSEPVEEEEQQQPEQALPVLDDNLGPGPVQCESRCRQIATYRVNMSHLVCEKHARRWMDIKNGKVPVALHCPDGFNTVRERNRMWHHPLGDFQRVQKCSTSRCGNIFTVYGYGPGEPARCPECLNEVWEQYKAERGD